MLSEKLSRAIRDHDLEVASNISRKKKEFMSAEDQLRSVAKQVLSEARKRAHYEMECLTQMVMQEAKAAARYAKQKPFYIS